MISIAALLSFNDFVLGNAQWLYAVLVVGCLLMIMTVLSYRAGSMPLVWKVAGVLIRGIGIGLLLLCLLEPMATLQRPKSHANIFGVVVDRSTSMDVLIREQQLAGDDSFLNAMRDDAQWQRKLADDFRVRRFALDAALNPIDTLEGLQLEGKESHIYESLLSMSDRFRGQPVAGVLVVSDGQSTDKRPDASLSKLGFPVYPVLLGEIDVKSDLRIASVTTSQSDFETSPVTISVKLNQRGLDGEPVHIDLTDSSGKRIQSQSIKLKKAGENVQVEFRFRPEGIGVQGFKVSARLDSEHRSDETVATVSTTRELTLENNHRHVVIDRGHGPYRILYVAGRPNWEHKFLKRSLEEDDEIRLTSLIRVAKKQMKFSFRDSKYDASNPLFSGFEDASEEEKEQYNETVFARLGVASGTEMKLGFPKDPAELFEYNAIVIDDLEHDFFSIDQLALIRQFVSARGGALLALGGQESFGGKGFSDSVLSQLIPVYVDEGGKDNRLGDTKQDMFDISPAPTYKYTLTREGWLQPFLRLAEGEAAEKARLDSMPPFHVMNRVQAVKPGATVLAQAADGSDVNLPVLVSQRFGKGRTAALMIGDMWRWGMHHPGNDTAPLYQAWRQMIRWLIADVPRAIQMRRDETSAASRIAKLIIDVRGSDFKSVDNAVANVSLVTPSGNTLAARAESVGRTPGQYQATFVFDAEGVYAATAEVLSSDGSQMGSAQLGWVYEPSVVEMADVGIDRGSLQAIADETGGEVVGIDRLESFVNSLPSRKVPVTETKIFPLWHQGWVFISSLMLLCFEWGLRRRYGMA